MMEAIRWTVLDLEGFARWHVRSWPHGLVISLSFLAFSMFADICRIMPGAIVSSTSFRISGDVLMSQLFSQATQCSLDFLEPVDSAADENWSSPQTLFQCSSPLLMAKPVVLSIGCWTALRAKSFYSCSFLMHAVQIANHQYHLSLLRVPWHILQLPPYGKQTVRAFEILSCLHSILPVRKPIFRKRWVCICIRWS